MQTMLDGGNVKQGNSLAQEVSFEEPQELKPSLENFYREPKFTFGLASALYLTEGRALLSADLMRQFFESLTIPYAPAKEIITNIKKHITAPNLYLRLLETGCLPSANYEIKPWHYKGWLLAQIIILDMSHPQMPNRWRYWTETLHKGCVLDEDIPRIEFCGEGSTRLSDGKKHLDFIIEKLWNMEGMNQWDAFREFTGWLAFGCGIANEMPRLKDSTQGWLYHNFNLEPFLLSPGDYLGDYLAMMKSGSKFNNPSAYFPTPMTVGKMMTEMLCTTADKCSTVCDPALGSGRLLLTASNYSLRLFGMDIDAQIVKVAQLNFAFYVPWGFAPFPEYFFEKKIGRMPELVDTSRDPQMWLFDDRDRLQKEKRKGNPRIKRAYDVHDFEQPNLFD